jgi:hypothetical protein
VAELPDDLVEQALTFARAQLPSQPRRTTGRDKPAPPYRADDMSRDPQLLTITHPINVPGRSPSRAWAVRGIPGGAAAGRRIRVAVAPPARRSLGGDQRSLPGPGVCSARATRPRDAHCASHDVRAAAARHRDGQPAQAVTGAQFRVVGSELR